MMFSNVSFAENNQTVADIKMGLISSMEKDGYLSQKMAGEVAQKYITEEDKKLTKENLVSQEAKTVSWSDFLSWINFVKVMGVLFLLIAFAGTIKRIIIGLWKFITKVPTYVYQGGFLSASLFGLICPKLIWAEEFFHVALLSSFSTLLILSWIVKTYPKLAEIFRKMFNIGVPIECVVSFYGMIYFGVLAVVYQSSIFGFFAAVCLSGVFSFGMTYMPGVLTLNFKEEMIHSVVFGHLIVLGSYLSTMNIVPEYTQYFNVGIQYYCTIALGVALLVAASPFYRSEIAVAYALIFIVVAIAASMGYFIYDLKVVSSILMVFFVLFLLEWIAYFGYRGGAIIGSAIFGGTLFGLAMLFEKYGSMIILRL